MLATSLFAAIAIGGVLSSPIQPRNVNETATEYLPYEITPGGACPPGYLLTYQLESRIYPEHDIATVQATLNPWSQSPFYNTTNGKGGNAAGATRTVTFYPDTILEEALVAITIDSTTLKTEKITALLNGPITATNGVSISNYTNSLTLYTNATTKETTVQWFGNLCATNQSQAQDVLGNYFVTGLADLASRLG